MSKGENGHESLSAPSPDAAPAVLDRKARKAAQIAARTPEMVAALKTKKDRKKKAKLEARQTLIDFVKSYADETVKLAAAKLWPNAMSGIASVPRESNKVTAGELLLSLFGANPVAGATISEAEVFQKIDGYGRMEMRKAMVRAVKNAKTPEERVWVSFDFTTKLYTLRNIGPDMPDPWSGFRPIEIPSA
jgi:hypothetical protein